MKFGILAHILSTIGTLNALQLKPKKSYRRSINASFGEVGRIASKDVILQLVKAKCLPIVLYGLECYPLNKAHTRSLDFASHTVFDENV